jgi:menaquinol-cytochrome c reductase iron-sulfur subunit
MESKSRRSFLNRITGTVFCFGAGVTAWPLLRSLVPNVLYEPPKRFGIGLPDRYQQGVTFLDEHRVYVFREGNGFYAVSGVCTHLGCTVKFSPFARKKEMTVRGSTFQAVGEFHCPCHGSKFHGEGTNYSGPAPRPLKWHPLEISPAGGELIVDLGREVNRDFRLVV